MSETMKLDFKATRKNSNSCPSYRQIEKSKSQYDLANSSDDTMVIMTKNGTRIIVDCDKTSGVFTIQVSTESDFYE